MKAKKGKLVKRVGVFAALSALTCMTLGISIFAEGAPLVKGNACYIQGDVNSDGKVSEDDALYLLYHSIYPEDYPIIQDGNLDQDEADGISVKDAYYLLDNMGNSDFVTTVHAYSDPAWSWGKTDAGEVTAMAIYNCACGDSETTSVKYATVETDVKAPTCIEAGRVTYTASVEFLGETDTATKVVDTTALGHVFAEGTFACADRECTVCDYVEKAEAHTYELTKETAATCTNAATETYTCTVCADTYTNEVGKAAGHKLGTEVVSWGLVEGETCKYNPVYECTTCKEEIPVELEADKVAVRHEYELVNTVEPKCTTDGYTEYKCSVCGDVHKVEIPANDNAHAWGDGEAADGITTYHCENANCDAEKTTINAKEETETTVSSDVLAEVGEVELNNTSIKLDEATLGDLTGDVEIAAGEASKEDLNVSDEIAAQIGNNPVYDFSIKADGEQVSEFSGEITISLPYTLGEGEDADLIDVWFIEEDGTVVSQKGTYSNGFVTFTTDHFSYYTVTRLTPAQRCEKYGHSETTRVIDPTCEEDGYTIHVCVRCGATWEDTVKDALGHDLDTETVDATCTKAGYEKETCKREGCKHVRKTTLPAIGHDWEVSESVDATCTAPGSETSECANCGETKEKTIAQLAHELETAVVKATCETKGYTVHACVNCDYEEIEDETAAIGHTYEATWTWDKENITAVLTLVCTNEGCDSVVTKDALITPKETKATCKTAGSITYTAEVVYNDVTYSDSYKVELPKLDHTISTEWKYDAAKHYHECSVCKEEVDAAEHAMNDGVVMNEATCTGEGTKVYSCECGYQKTETVAALGHEFTEDGVCTRCGYEENNCKHDKFTTYEVELNEEAGMCEGTLTYTACDCGEVAYFEGYDLGCDMEYDYTTSTDENGHVTYHLEMNCIECGASVVEDEYWDVNGDCVGTLYMDLVISNAEDAVVAEFHGIEASYADHPPVVYGETIDLTQYGFCNGTLVNTSCACGSSKSFIMNSDCNFVEVSEECGEQKYVSACTDCGIKIVNTWGIKDLGNCEGRYEDLYVCYKDGVEVFRYEESNDTMTHDFEYSFELDGTTCSDGYTVHMTCTKCGSEHSYHDAALEGEHDDIFWKSVDVSEYELCIDEMNVYYCPCGGESWSNIGYECDFTWYGYSESETDNGWMYVDTGVCDYCGLTIKEEVYCNYTENPCIVDTDRTYVYSKDGKEIYTVHSTGTMSDHNYISVGHELEGESCEDGVTIIYECQDCGEVYEEYISWHRDMILESYDLEEYGMCGGTFEVYGCACGEYRDWWENSDCDWEYYDYDETTDSEIWKCTECGIFRSRNYTETELEGCMVVATSTITYFNDTEPVLIVEISRNAENHNFAYTYELDGEVCSDGYTVFAVCKDCGAEDSWYNQPDEGEHWTFETEYVDLTEFGFCGGFIRKWECPCGENSGYGWNWNACDFEWYDEMDDGTTWYKCSECGSYYSYLSEFVGEEDCYKNYLITYTFYNDDLEEVYAFEKTERYSNHNYVYSFDIEEGAVCSDGFEVTETCTKCDYSYTWYREPSEGSHPSYVVERYDLEDHGFCGAEVVHYQCACGEYDHYERWHSDCYFVYDEYNSETEMERYVCETCGASYEYGYDEREVDACHIAYDYTYVYYTPEGEEVFRYTNTSIGENHDCSYTFELDGESCTDGYTVYADCKNCDYAYETYNTYHSNYLVDSFDFGEAGYCGGTINVYECPCGESGWYSSTGMDCSWYRDSYDEETATTTYKCSECGLIRKSTEIRGEKDEDCDLRVTTHYTYLDENGTVLVECDSYYWTTNHSYYYEFDMLGESCEDGYYVTTKCKDCDYCYEDDYLREYHSTWTVDSQDVSELGFCEGILRHEVCPCGRYDNYNLYTDCYFSYDYETETYVCEYCGVIKEQTSESEEVDECYTRYDYDYTYTKDDEVILEYTNTSYSEHHTPIYEFTFEDEEAGCEGGYTGTGSCKYCGKTMHTSGSSHNTYLVKKYDLVDYDACEGSVITYSACPCGERHYLNTDLYGYCDIAYTSNSYTDDNGIVHDVEQRTCRECGLIFKQDRVTTLNVEDCTRTITNTVTIAVDKTAVDQFTYAVTEEYHDTVATAELADGAVDCEDGVIVTHTCKNCDYSYSNTYSWHYEVEKARYDLSKYGSVCGGYLVHDACPCGYDNYVSFENMECDLDTDWDYAWSGESYDGQETTEGWFYPDSYGYKYTCAVTDPQCDFVARRCHYYEWDKENCAMTRYEVWQFGCEYDSEGNFVSCKEEIKFEGSTRAYHDYVAETVTEGNRTTTIETCSQCGSTHTYSSEYSNTGYTLYYEDTCVNKLDNGENKFRSEIREYVTYSDYSFQAKDYFAVTYADGEEYWRNYEYTYDFNNFKCMRTCHYTNSDGEDETYEETCHPADYCKYETIEENSCSQFGKEHHYHECVLCGAYTYDDIYDTYPNEHWWTDYDEETGMYTCEYCGLQNTNGADGTIVVEDLTEAYGEGTDFVVGYWNRSEVQFVYNLSVMLGEEYDIVLDGITFTELTRDVDGITAITFNQQAAKEAAIAALEAAGCTDTTGYELRFAFVPLSSDSDFDYAITFTAEDLAE